MKLPNQEKASVAREKIVNYLLSPFHRDGKGKAAFFKKLGFTSEMWQILAESLKRHALENEVGKTEATPFGIRYVVEGELNTPIGTEPKVRVVWFIETGSDVPRLATAYPLRERK